MSQKVLVVKGKAGLGNRLLLLLDSILYAELTGRRLIIDWRDRAYAVGGVNAFNEYFATPLAGDPAVVEAAASVAPVAWRGHLDKTADQLLAHYYPGNEDAEEDPAVVRRTAIDTRRRDHGEDVLVRWGWTHELYNLRRAFTGPLARFAGLADDDILRAVLREHLKPSAPVAEKVAALRARLDGAPTIALHVRYSDRKNPYQGYGAYVDDWLTVHPGGAVFLATDNAEVEGFFRARYPRVLTLEKWFPTDGSPIHRTREGRDVITAGIDALTDMYALGSCDALVYNSTSTFGVIASLISQAPARWRIDTAPTTLKQRVKKRVKRLKNFLHARGLTWPLERP